jgi:hypothetical protein
MYTAMYGVILSRQLVEAKHRFWVGIKKRVIFADTLFPPAK